MLKHYKGITFIMILNNIKVLYIKITRSKSNQNLYRDEGSKLPKVTMYLRSPLYGCVKTCSNVIFCSKVTVEDNSYIFHNVG